MTYLKTWLKNGRVGALVQSVMPAVLAVVLAIGHEGFNVWLALIAVLGVECAHLALNLSDDYFDYKADMLADRVNVVRKGFKAYTAKYPYLTDYWTEEGMAPGTYMPRRQEMPFVREWRLERFEDMELPVPANAEEQCLFRYGSDYMTPNPAWDNHRRVECIHNWPEMVSKTVHLTYPKL